jgi:hypothetical protein
MWFKKFLQYFPSPRSSGEMRTLDLEYLGRVFYHCVARVQATSKLKTEKDSKMKKKFFGSCASMQVSAMFYVLMILDLILIIDHRKI